jgi:hypothetical protein
MQNDAEMSHASFSSEKASVLITQKFAKWPRSKISGYRVRNFVTSQHYHESPLCNSTLCTYIFDITFLIRQAKEQNRKMNRKYIRRDLKLSMRAHGDSRHVVYNLLKIFPWFTWTLKIRAARFSELSLTIYEPTWLHITEDMNLQGYINCSFPKRSYIQLKCVNYTFLLEGSCPSQDCRPITVQIPTPCLLKNTSSYDLCDYDYKVLWLCGTF